MSKPSSHLARAKTQRKCFLIHHPPKERLRNSSSHSSLLQRILRRFARLLLGRSSVYFLTQTKWVGLKKNGTPILPFIKPGAQSSQKLSIRPNAPASQKFETQNDPFFQEQRPPLRLSPCSALKTFVFTRPAISKPSGSSHHPKMCCLRSHSTRPQQKKKACKEFLKEHEHCHV